MSPPNGPGSAPPPDAPIKTAGVKAIISAISPMAMFHCRLDLISGRTTAIVEMRLMIKLPQTQAAGK
jgi:hypothetical protein